MTEQRSDCPLMQTCEYPLVGYGCEFAIRCGRIRDKLDAWDRYASFKLSDLVGIECPSCHFDLGDHTAAEFEGASVRPNTTGDGSAASRVRWRLRARTFRATPPDPRRRLSGRKLTEEPNLPPPPAVPLADT